MDDGQYPSLAQLKALRVVDLKQLLAQQQLPQSGLKADLVARLDQHFNSLRAQQLGGEQEDEEDPVDQQAAQIEAQRMAEQEAQQLAAEQEAQRQAEEAQRMAAEQEAQRRAAEEEAARQAAEEEAQRRAAEEEAQRRAAQEEAARQAAAEEAARQAAEEAQRRAAEEEAARQAAAEEAQRRAAEEEAQKRAAEEEAQKRAAEEEAARQAAEEEAARQAAEEEATRQDAEEEATRQAAEEEAARQAAEEKAARQAAAEEAHRRAAEEEAAKQLAEAEAQRLAAEQEAQRQAAEEEAQRQAAAEEANKKESAPAEPLVAHQAIRQPPALFAKGPAVQDLELDGDPTPAGPISSRPEPPKPKENLPKVLEDALAIKPSRPEIQIPSLQKKAEPVVDDAAVMAEVEAEAAAPAPSPAAGGTGNKKKDRKKKKKRNRPEEWAREAAEKERRRQEEEERAKQKEQEGEVEIEYVQEKLDMDPADPMYRTFAKIFDAFKLRDEDDDAGADPGGANGGPHGKDGRAPAAEELKKVPKLLEEDDLVAETDDADGDGDDDKPKLSKRKLKKLTRLSVAELKQLVQRPDVVEMHDVTARDPKLLVHLKSTRNTVPVPRHWCFKRKYLQGKRGIEKPPFHLPEFIRKTGIMEMRASLQEKEDAQSLKSKMRDKVRPKLGKIDIDYQKLHDAFFKWQTKPKLTLHGDLYYEGKEFEIRLKEKKPGDLTDDLRTALGMPVGPNAHKVPPPWLIAMQRYGPPPSYPNLKIPGLNAPIPDGCSFGYHAGGWGKPPVDESGKPLYGDVFGTADAAYQQHVAQEEIDTSLWGELDSDEEEESSSEEDEDEEREQDDEDGDAEKAEDASGMQTPAIDAGLNTPSGMSSVGLGLGGETPELLELRKKRIEAEMEGGETPNLYTVLPEKRHDRVGASMMGSAHTYDLGKKAAGSQFETSNSGVEMALNPEEVDLMDTEAMQARAEAALREQQASLAKEDLSDMVAEHAAKQSSRRKRQAAKDDDQKGKAKKFKF